MEHPEEKRILNSIIVPAIFLALIWVIKFYEVLTKTDFSEYGILPQTATGLKGILFSPLLHADYHHAAANSVPLFVLLSGLFYYYRKLAWQILALLWLVTGFWVWVFAADTGYHIGASGVIYALVGFHFTSGVIRREARMAAFSLLVVFLYGSLIWGVIPNFLPEKNISWESHLLGLLAGVLLAFYYRKVGPQRKTYVWEEDQEAEEESDEEDSQIQPGDENERP
jgi:membrane associated rhomboid family serine protease